MLVNLFYIINFSLSIIFSIIALIFAFTTIFVVFINRQRHTVTNLLTCDTAVGIILLYINTLTSTAYSFRNDWFFHQPACVFRGYCFMVSCTALCYSYLIQAISRLFFSVFYKHKKLQARFIHWIMIIINWILAFLIPIPSIFLNGYILETEARLCVATTKNFKSAVYLIFSVYLLPLISIGIIYGIILYYALQSTRRIRNAIAQTNTVTVTTNITLPNYKRELKLMKNTSILFGILTCAGIPYAIVVFLHVTLSYPPPESLYLLIINSIAIFASLMMIALFFMNRDVRKATVNYLQKLNCVLK